MRLLSFPRLFFVTIFPRLAAGFVLRAPPTGAGSSAAAGKNTHHASSRPNPPALETASVKAPTLRRCLGNGGRRLGPTVWRRRRCPTTVPTAAADAVAEVDTAYEPGRERAPHEPAVQAFEAWASSAGCRGGSASLSHADFDGLRGVMTNAAVGPWQPAATVPASLVLQEELLYSSSSPSAAASAGTAPPLPPPAPLSVEAWRRCPWWVRLGVRLLKERVAGEDSRLKEYVRMLPPPGETGMPADWSAAQLDRLHYPRLLSQIKLQRRIFKGFRRFLLADAKRGENSPSAGEDGSSNPFIDALGDATVFNWALECVLSRAFQLPPDDAAALVFGEGDDTPVKAPELTPPAPEATRMALVPLIDSINHYSRIPTHMYWEDDGALSLSVGASYDPGDHVFMSYGPVSNDDLLQYYGFVERENPSDAYVLQDMGKWLREDALLSADLSNRLLACPGAREVWRYLRRGVILRDAVHPTTMQALRILSCEAPPPPSPRASNDGDNPSDVVGDDAGDGTGGEPERIRWDGTEEDLSRFANPVSLASEMAALELLMRYSAREADAWGEAGVAAALAEDPTAPGLDGDLDGLGLDADRRLMLSVFRQEKLALLRGIVSRLTHMRKVSGLLNRPIKMPVNASPPPVLGAVNILAKQ